MNHSLVDGYTLTWNDIDSSWEARYNMWSYKFDVLMLRAKDEHDVKVLFLKFIHRNDLREHVKNRYPHLKDILDKLLILK